MVDFAPFTPFPFLLAKFTPMCTFVFEGIVMFADLFWSDCYLSVCLLLVNSQFGSVSKK
jgi:hypothetical protein